MSTANFIGLGVAGNYPNHLSQIKGEAEYASVNATSSSAPKGLFPWFVKNEQGYLSTDPLSSNQLWIPSSASIHPEAELALDCEIKYSDNSIVENVIPRRFGIINDATERHDDKTVTEKKNWGHNSKGLSSQFFDLDKFDTGSVLDHYVIVSWIKRQGEHILYTDFCNMNEYMTFYRTLQEWLVDALNHQKKAGPLDDLSKSLATAGYPTRSIIGVGATKYTKFAETNYLQDGDIYKVALFDETQHTKEIIESKVKDGSIEITSGCLALVQQVVVRN